MPMKNYIMRTVALALLLYALAVFAGSLRRLDGMRGESAELQARLAGLRRENAELCAMLEGVSSEETVQALARERLALVMPGEKIFYFKSDGE